MIREEENEYTVYKTKEEIEHTVYKIIDCFNNPIEHLRDLIDQMEENGEFQDYISYVEEVILFLEERNND